MAPSPTGAQWTLRHGEDEVTVVEVGGGLRSWTRGGRHVLASYARGEECTSGRGQVLIPWPNRVRDGRYRFGGRDRQLALTEPEYHNATHGLVRWALWELRQHEADHLTVGYRLHPQPGWAWHLDCTTTYAVGPAGLVVTASVTNVGDEPAPFGYGAHPYLFIGDAAVGDVEVSIPAATRVEVDDRSLPAGRRSVSGTAYDFRRARALGQTRLDTAYTDIEPDPDGCWRVTVAPPGLPACSVWGEAAAFPWLQVFSQKAEAGQPGAHGIAVEPMTCPADSFNSGEDLLVLDAGQRWSGTWGISPQG